MTAPLLYRPNHRWRIWAAFTGAVLVHVAAIAMARTQPQNMSGPESAYAPVDISIDAPAPDPVEVPLLIEPPVAIETDFPEENSTPPPVRKISQKQIQPIHLKAPSFAGPTTMRAAKVVALNAPRPAYPYEARRQRTIGSGIAVLTIDSATGDVIEVLMTQSTGSPILDNATITAFRRWRFRPGTVSTVQTPITYALTGASY